MSRIFPMILLIVQVGFTQFPGHFNLSRDGYDYSPDSTSFSGLGSNSIVDIQKGPEDLIYFGTSGGFGYAHQSDNGQLSLYTYNRGIFPLPVGGNPGLAVLDSVIAVSGAVQEMALGEYHPAGSGIGYSNNAGQTWSLKPQPIDPPDSPIYLDFEWGDQTLKRLAITTEINNVSYDLAIMGDYIYSASWAGGIQRFKFRNYPPGVEGDIPNPWEPIPLPMDNEQVQYCSFIDSESFVLNPNDPGNGGSHNHKGFSVYAIGDTLWVGTAGGINKGIVRDDGCIDWRHFTSSVDGISGNWVIGFTHQELEDDFIRLWAITWSTGYTESYGLSYTDDGGETWNIVQQLDEMNLKVFSVHSNEVYLFASSESGLFLTDNGEYWEKYSTPTNNGGQILTDIVYSSYSFSSMEGVIVGTPDGIAMTNDSGTSWDIHRFWTSTVNGETEDDRFYAYPNPFYVNHANVMNGDGHVRLVFSLDGNSIPLLDIYDFAMERVVHLSDSYIVGNQNEGEIIWNGRNDWGDIVSNGVYFCRLSMKGKYFWTKLLVIN